MLNLKKWKKIYIVIVKIKTITQHIQNFWDSGKIKKVVAQLKNSTPKTVINIIVEQYCSLKKPSFIYSKVKHWKLKIQSILISDLQI